jgi:hypothetical protein
MQEKVGNNGVQGLAKESNNLKNRRNDYLVDLYIGIAKRRGWDEVVRLLAQYPDTEAEMKMLIKKRLGK